MPSGVCYIDTACSAGNQYRARDKGSNTCVPTSNCYFLYACNAATAGGTCGGSNVCTISPGCASGVQKCSDGYCTSVSTCDGSNIIGGCQATPITDVYTRHFTPGFYIANLTLLSGEPSGFYGLEVLTSKGQAAGGFNAGGAVHANSQLPGFAAFYLDRPKTVTVTLNAQPPSGTIIKLRFLDADKNQVGNSISSSSLPITLSQYLPAGFFIAEVTNTASSRVTFQLGLSADYFSGGIDAGGYMGPGIEGFGAFYVPEEQDVVIKIYDNRSYGTAGAGKIRLRLYDEWRNLLDVNRPQSPGMEFVDISAGWFNMGSADGFKDEQNIHPVVINKSFQMGKFEVTQGQWKAVMGGNPSYFSGNNNLPVDSVSWDAAQVFIAALNSLNDGFLYRLPTEAEWEYACRAGKTGDPNETGDIADMGWFDQNQTHPVGFKKPNAWGLYDMYGNVSEWTQDWSNGDYNSSRPQIFPSGPLTSRGDKLRINRGGSWEDSFLQIGLATRNHQWPSVSLPTQGLRIVRVPR